MSSSDPEHDGSADPEQPSTPKPDPLDVDSAFAAIIAGWADAPTSGAWPAEEDITSGRHRRDGSTDRVGEADGSGEPDTGRADDGLDDDALTRSGGPLIPSLDGPFIDPPELEPEGFVPPDPPPLPRGDVISWLAWAGVVGGPLFLLAAVIAWQDAPQILVLTAIAGFVGGFIVLVSRMPKHRDEDDDNGAVV
jgi:hypothetical protein